MDVVCFLASMKFGIPSISLSCRVMDYFRGVEYFSGPKPSLNEARSYLLNFTGGKIVCEKDGRGIAKICIEHEGKKNAISGSMMIDLEKIVDDLENWTEGKGILLYGANGIFCSGGDLNFAKEANKPELGFCMSILMTNILRRFSNLPIVSVAYIDGAGAIGGGAEVTTACDYRLMADSPDTRIGFVHCKMGLVPAWGGTARLVGIVGRTLALDLLLSGKLLDGEEACRLGLVNGVAPNLDEAYNWILEKTKHDAKVVRAAKACITNSLPLTDDIVEAESRIFAPLWGGPANNVALRRNIKHKT